jgi:hypothetical protein
VPAEPAPPAAAAQSFLAAPADAPAVEHNATAQGRVEMRDGATTLFTQAKPATAPDSAWVHRNYLAK